VADSVSLFYCCNAAVDSSNPSTGRDVFSSLLGYSSLVHGIADSPHSRIVNNIKTNTTRCYLLFLAALT